MVSPRIAALALLAASTLPIMAAAACDDDLQPKATVEDLIVHYSDVMDTDSLEILAGLDEGSITYDQRVTLLVTLPFRRAHDLSAYTLLKPYVPLRGSLGNAGLTVINPAEDFNSYRTLNPQALEALLESDVTLAAVGSAHSLLVWLQDHRARTLWNPSPSLLRRLQILVP